MTTTFPSNTQRTLSTPAPAPKRWQLWTGRVLSALLTLMLLMSASLKLMHAPDFVATWTGKLGWPEGLLSSIGVLELACLLVYAVPRTAFFGAILLSAYFGGAVATHVRVGDPFVIPIVLGVFVWAGLFLRDGRLRSLVLARA